MNEIGECMGGGEQMNTIEIYAEKLKETYPTYCRLDSEMKKIVFEIAKKYPYNVEYVACIFLMCCHNQEETEKYIVREMMYGVV